MNPELPNATSLPLTPTPFGQIALDSGTTRVAAPSKALPWLCREEYEALLKDLVENSELKPLDGPAIRIICAKLPSCDLVVKFPTAQAFIAFLSLGVRDLSERILWMQKAKEKFDSLVHVSGRRGYLLVIVDALDLDQSEDAADLFAFVHKLSIIATEDKRVQVIIFPPCIKRREALLAVALAVSRAEKIQQEAAVFRQGLLGDPFVISEIQVMLQERGRAGV